jgi:hypothetical protein
MKTRKRFTGALQDEYLVHLRQGMRRGATAELMGFSRLTLMNYIEDHPDFERRVLDAEGEASEHVEEALYQAAVSGNVSAARAWMELRPSRRSEVPFPMAQAPPREPAPADSDEDELFPPNVTRMDPRSRRKSNP